MCASFFAVADAVALSGAHSQDWLGHGLGLE